MPFRSTFTRDELTLPAGVAEPHSLFEVVSSFNRSLREGQIDFFAPIPTGFDPLDKLLGGGLQSGDLLLLGGPQGVGKTTLALQMARNIAREGLAEDKRARAILVCFEHTEDYLYLRLIGLESFLSSNGQGQGITRDELSQAIRQASRSSRALLDVDEVIRRMPRIAGAMERIHQYQLNLKMILGSARRTTPEVLARYVRQEVMAGFRVVLFVDYLQVVPYEPPIGVHLTRDEVIGRVINELKDLALETGATVVAVAAADREGLRSGRVRLADLFGPSMVQYACDGAIIQNPGPPADQGRKDVIWTIEKNRTGPVDVAMRFTLHGAYFCFAERGEVVPFVQA